MRRRVIGSSTVTYLAGSWYEVLPSVIALTTSHRRSWDTLFSAVVHALDFGAVTDRGNVRPVNEDSILAVPPVFVVADGVGGGDAGDVASGMVVEEFARLTTDPPQLDSTGRPTGSDSDPSAGMAPTIPAAGIDPDDVRDALAAAHQRVLALHACSAHGAGSTAVGAVGVLVGNEPYWVVFNVGDSRLYRLMPPEWDGHAQPAAPAASLPIERPESGSRPAELTQISVDHSHVQELLDAGLITSDQAEHHPGNNLVTRAIGSPDSSEPDFWMLPMVPDDRLLICSDGLTSEVGIEIMTEVVAARRPPRETAAELLRLTLDAGARDNVSVIVVDVSAGRVGDVDVTTDNAVTKPVGETPASGREATTTDG